MNIGERGCAAAHLPILCQSRAAIVATILSTLFHFCSNICCHFKKGCEQEHTVPQSLNVELVNFSEDKQTKSLIFSVDHLWTFYKAAVVDHILIIEHCNSRPTKTYSE